MKSKLRSRVSRCLFSVRWGSHRLIGLSCDGCVSKETLDYAVWPKASPWLALRTLSDLASCFANETPSVLDQGIASVSLESFRYCATFVRPQPWLYPFSSATF